MKRLLVALGVGVVGGIAVFMPVARESSLPFIAPPEQPVRVLFVGDIMLDRNVARTAAEFGVPYLFASTSELFADADVRVANLEGTVTDYPSVAQRDHTILHFTFAPDVAREALDSLHLSAVSLANNHSLDFGPGGYAQTRNRVEAAGVAAFGHPYNLPGELSAVVQSGGELLCFVGYHALFDPATTTVVEEIQTLRPDCWRTIVFAHWGEEYHARSNAAQEAAAHAFIDAGADLVVGAHPHVVQNVETYKGRAIFYSLGNFMFDQNFSSATTHGLAVRADFYEHKTDFILTPTVIADQHASVDTTGVAEFGLP